MGTEIKEYKRSLKTKKVSLRLTQDIYDFHIEKSVSDDRSFNSYMNHLLKSEMSKAKRTLL